MGSICLEENELNEAKRILRKAIYIPFPQAVPNKYLIDADICNYVKEPFLFSGATFSKLKKEKVPEEIVENLRNLFEDSINLISTFSFISPKVIFLFIFVIV